MVNLFYGLAAFFASFFIIFFVIAILAIVANYKLFEKAGVEGWKCLIPFYNVYVATVEVAKLDVIWFALTFAAFIPFIGSLVAVVAYVNIIYSIARRFTKEKELRIIATIFSGIFLFVFAFGDYKYDNGTYSKHGFFSDSTVENVKSTVTGNSSSSGSANFCRNCGNKVNPGEKFCENCGTKL